MPNFIARLSWNARFEWRAPPPWPAWLLDRVRDADGRLDILLPRRHGHGRRGHEHLAERPGRTLRRIPDEHDPAELDSRGRRIPSGLLIGVRDRLRPRLREERPRIRDGE